MKILIRITFFVFATIAFAKSVHSQQRASDKSFNTILAEVKQKQNARNKLIQQMHQSQSVNAVPATNTGIQGNLTNGNPTNTRQVDQRAVNHQPLKPTHAPMRVKTAGGGNNSLTILLSNRIA